MPIDPQVLAHYEAKKAAAASATPASTIDDIRKGVDAIYNDSRQWPPVAKTEDRTIPCFWGGLPVRVYHPGEEGPYPVLLYFHGGGFMIHNIASHDSLCRALCNETGAVVVNVGYRLAPEAKWPAWNEDGYAALEWVYDNADLLNADRTHIALAGDSAGAMISASVSLMARDRRGPKVGLQILAYGASCGLTEDESESFRTLVDNNYVLSRPFLSMMETYSGADAHRYDAYTNPGRAKDLSNMPKTFSLNAEYDPLRDDGEEFARRLRAAGNDVIAWRVPGMMHGFLLLYDKFDTAGFAVKEIGRVFRETFAE